MLQVLVAGHSHVASIERGYMQSSGAKARMHMKFLKFTHYSSDGSRLTIDASASAFEDKARDADVVLLLITGNEHNVVGLLEIDTAKEAEIKIASAVQNLNPWLDKVTSRFSKRVCLLLPPPPIEADAQIQNWPGIFAEKIKEFPIRRASERLKLWRFQCQLIQKLATKRKLEVIPLPESGFSKTGFLAEDCYGRDPTHGNALYGQRAVEKIITHLQDPKLPIGQLRAKKSAPRNFYSGLPDYAFWKQSISTIDAAAVDPVTSPRFKIARTDRVATAGSCFAQHISKRLRTGGFSFLVTEGPDQGSTAEAESRGFYDFSARYGNVYTTRQLLQLFDRAFGYYRPREPVWRRLDGRFCDPFRPRIEPRGYADKDAVLGDTAKHLLAVKEMFQKLDVFVFTLGLTECWASRLDGAVYPIAPGVTGGEYDPAKQVLLNFRVNEIVADLQQFLDRLRLVNRNAKVILTVSPVPLVATAVDRHVLVSTTYSKSVLRVAVEEIKASNANVDYFPSFEIITGPHALGGYFGSDRRSVTEQGVDHVMRVFMSRMTEAGDMLGVSTRSAGSVAKNARAGAEMEALAATACDEEILERKSE